MDDASILDLPLLKASLNGTRSHQQEHDIVEFTKSDDKSKQIMESEKGRSSENEVYKNSIENKGTSHKTETPEIHDQINLSHFYHESQMESPHEMSGGREAGEDTTTSSVVVEAVRTVATSSVPSHMTMSPGTTSPEITAGDTSSGILPEELITSTSEGMTTDVTMGSSSEGVTTDVTTMGSSSEGVTTDVTTMGSSSEGMTTDVTTMGSSSEGMTTDVTTMGSSSEGMTTDVTTMGSSSDGMTTDVTTMGSSSEAMTTDVITNTSLFGNTKTDVTTLSSSESTITDVITDANSSEEITKGITVEITSGNSIITETIPNDTTMSTTMPNNAMTKELTKSEIFQEITVPSITVHTTPVNLLHNDTSIVSIVSNAIFTEASVSNHNNIMSELPTPVDENNLNDIHNHNITEVPHISEHNVTNVEKGGSRSTTPLIENNAAMQGDQSSNKGGALGKEVPRVFTCTELSQKIPEKRHCDGIQDCEDGSDERHCGCHDYLLATAQSAICDGHADCADLSDEQDCGFCQKDEFHCPKSGSCIPQHLKCDHKVDCQFREDEMDCFGLTDGKTVYMDIEGRSHLISEGLLSYSQEGEWRPLCVHNPHEDILLAKDICQYLGFSGYEGFNKTYVMNSLMTFAPLAQYHEKSNTEDVVIHPITVPSYAYAGVTVNNIQYEDTSYRPGGDQYVMSDALDINAHTVYSRVLRNVDTSPCPGLFVKCSDQLEGDEDTFKLHSLKENSMAWPWHAEIYIESIYRCSAILLNQDWLLTSTKCLQYMNLYGNHVTALLGQPRPHLNTVGPHQQIRRVDDLRVVADAILLHVEEPVFPTRYVYPLHLPHWIFIQSDEENCVAVGHDALGTMQSVFLQPVKDFCRPEYKCFKHTNLDSVCKVSQNQSWIGTIACHSNLGWYPAAVYHVPDGFCGSPKIKAFPNIIHIRNELYDRMGDLLDPVPSPSCSGLRCPLGRCLDPALICNGVRDCEDNSDEDSKFCLERFATCLNDVHTHPSECACHFNEFQCRTGHCVLKSTFCDGHNDCGDWSDEPSVCNCRAYLQLVAPHQICDGNRNCLDKTDEQSCSCSESSFKCSSSSQCIPPDFVCDGESDCLDEEDELMCVALSSDEHHQNSGEVKIRSYGVWHTYCASEEQPHDQLSKLCQQLGYTELQNSTLNSHRSEDDHGILLPELDPFTAIRLNSKTKITIRGNRPFVQFVKPNGVCNIMSITCA